MATPAGASPALANASCAFAAKPGSWQCPCGCRNRRDLLRLGEARASGKCLRRPSGVAFFLIGLREAANPRTKAHRLGAGHVA
jgi:hypothetical protein